MPRPGTSAHQMSGEAIRTSLGSAILFNGLICLFICFAGHGGSENASHPDHCWGLNRCWRPNSPTITDASLGRRVEWCREEIVTIPPDSQMMPHRSRLHKNVPYEIIYLRRLEKKLLSIPVLIFPEKAHKPKRLSMYPSWKTHLLWTGPENWRNYCKQPPLKRAVRPNWEWLLYPRHGTGPGIHCPWTACPLVCFNTKHQMNMFQLYIHFNISQSWCFSILLFMTNFSKQAAVNNGVAAMAIPYGDQEINITARVKNIYIQHLAFYSPSIIQAIKSLTREADLGRVVWFVWRCRCDGVRTRWSLSKE